MLASGDIELKAVPGAGDDAARQRPFAKWPALMRANAIQGMEVASDIEKRNDPIARHKLAARAGRQVSGFRDRNPVRHEDDSIGREEEG